MRIPNPRAKKHHTKRLIPKHIDYLITTCNEIFIEKKRLNTQTDLIGIDEFLNKHHRARARVMYALINLLAYKRLLANCMMHPLAVLPNSHPTC